VVVIRSLASETEGGCMPSRPNVLLLLTDQERADLVAPDGLPVDTPNIDRLREDGMWFDSAYTPTSICTSARASLLTGLYPHAHGLLNNSHEATRSERICPRSCRRSVSTSQRVATPTPISANGTSVTTTHPATTAFGTSAAATTITTTSRSPSSTTVSHRESESLNLMSKTACTARRATAP